MNINQALRRAKILKGRIAEWSTRAQGANVVNHGENDPKPVYQFDECQTARKDAIEELLRLSTAVAVANATKKVSFNEQEMTLTEALHRLQNIKAEIAWLQRISALPQNEVKGTRPRQVWDTKERTFQYVDEPFKQTCTLSTRDVQRRVDELQETFDGLNGLVESANHQTDIGV